MIFSEIGEKFKMATKKVAEVYDYDFGFTTTSSKEILNSDTVEVELSNTKKQVQKLQKKLYDYNALIQPLLVNLAKNPENEFIKWPNRVAKIDEIQTKINNLFDE